MRLLSVAEYYKMNNNEEFIPWAHHGKADTIEIWEHVKINGVECN